MFPTEVSNLPGQIEAALQFLRFTEEIIAPKNYSGPTGVGRKLPQSIELPHLPKNAGRMPTLPCSYFRRAASVGFFMSVALRFPNLQAASR
jgi:hypothetical protein